MIHELDHFNNDQTHSLEAFGICIKMKSHVF